jgi:nitrite reductase/ring-hydroxylating ferredoxin subunit
MTSHSIYEMAVIARVADIGDPGSREFLVVGGDSSMRGFLVRKGDQVFAYVNRCPHTGSPLNRSPDGFLGSNNQLIMCRSHGAMFEIESGICVAGICSGQSLQKLPIHARDGVISLKYDVSLEQWV